MNDTLSKIRARAAAEWPDDYSMQHFEIEKQTEAFEKMQMYQSRLDQNNPVVAACLTKAISDWSDDYSMQVFEFEKQLDAANNFFSYENNSIPQEVVDKVKERAFAEWSDDYSMMLYELENQLNAWLAING